MTSTQAPRPTRRGRQTLEAIDAAARKVIAEKGFLKMTVADIVKEAGKSPASFYNYYDSKEALLEHWARQFQDEARERLAEAERVVGKDPRERVEAAARAHWETCRARLAEMVGVFQLAMINDEFAAVWDEICSEAEAGIARAVTRAQERGFAPGADAALTARAIVAMLNMFCYENLANGRAARVDDEACITTLANAWYHAIYWTD
ncbi:TetR/AcrR family transcriptional regulator [Pimelobacter simplex]|uniref:TetR/AcrR family transcriptional regulator n=1 Tax=Nocardioides simplex TaxID=2045 RepID=A0A7J5E2T0_NOCSI|nr:TetR/AcrR family transcriptional regulator [Pimelobacter simplex]KAB2812549.1 TetR/AcrR family transcriptional regulator [Pimelobacter simplex]